MDQSFPPLSLGGIPREIRDITTGYAVKEEKVIYHKVKIAENEPVSLSSFTIGGYGHVCRQFRAEYTETLSRHIQHITIVGDLSGNKLFDTDRYHHGFRAKISLARQANSPSWQCHPVLPSLSHIQLQSSFTNIVFEAFQGHYKVLHGEEQKVSVSFEFLLSKQAREALRCQEATLYDNIFSGAKLQEFMQAYTKDAKDITQVDNKRLKPSVKAIIAVGVAGRGRANNPQSYHEIFKALCGTMETFCNEATWPALCCCHQNCNCFTTQVQAYIKSTLVRCRAFPKFLYAFDSYTKPNKDNATLPELRALHSARSYRNQIRDSWVTGCNRNFEIFSESDSCYMDCKEGSLPHTLTTTPF